MLTKTDIKNGVLPATVTPWTDEYLVNKDDLMSHVEALSQVDGVVALVCNAHSGEGRMLARDTKAEIIRLHKEAAGRIPIVAGVAGESTLLTIAEMEDAAESGADAVMPLPPQVFAYGDLPVEIAVSYYEDLAEGVPKLPIIAFQFPSFGAKNIPPEAWVNIVQIPSVIGLKEASFNILLFERTVRLLDASGVRDHFTLITGNDTFILHSYLLGAESGLLLYTNLLTELHVEKLRAVRSGNIPRAQEIREQMLPLTNFIFGPPERNLIARVKEALVFAGAFDSARVLPPQPEIGEMERQELKHILSGFG